MQKKITSDCEIHNQTEHECDFSTLPPHILSKILFYLTIRDLKHASLTCKTWYYASCDPRIAEHIFLYFTSEPVDCESVFVRPVTKICFESLDFGRFDYKKLLRNCGHTVTELHINCRARLRMTQLFEMFIYLSNLKVLRLDYAACYKPNNFHKHKRIAKNTIGIMQNLSQVRELQIRTTEKNLKGAEILLRYCKNLKTLNWNENYSQPKPDNFLNDVLINPIKNCVSESLVSLTIHSIDRTHNFLETFLSKLIDLNLTNVRSLDLREISDTYYSNTFKEFCKTYKDLERLTLYGLNDQQLADICKYMRNIKALNLNYASVANFNHIGYLNNLEKLDIYRRSGSTDDSLIEFFRLKPLNLKDLTLNIIDSVLLKEICENLPQLKRLYLEYIETKECQPIFHHLTKLEQLHLQFKELSQINSKLMTNHLEWNVTKLVKLKDLYVSTFLPGFTPDLIRTLPNLKSIHHTYIYDPPESQHVEEVNQMNNINENIQIEEVPHYFLNEPDIPNVGQSQDMQYDLTEFDVFTLWFCDIDNNTITA